MYPFPFLLFNSNLVQLWALPVIGVGLAVLGRAGDKRARQTYDDAEAILHEALQIEDHLGAQDAKLLELEGKLEGAVSSVEDLVSRLQHLVPPSAPKPPD